MRRKNIEHRRRVPRQPAGWRGLCLIAAESPVGWHDCRVVDISTLGLGITRSIGKVRSLVVNRGMTKPGSMLVPFKISSGPALRL